MLHLCLAVLLGGPASAQVSTQAEAAAVGERMSAHVLDALDGVLGPGRAKVQVEVKGEISNLHTETEMVIPIRKPKSKADAANTPAASDIQRFLAMPGYSRESAPPSPYRDSLPGQGPQKPAPTDEAAKPKSDEEGSSFYQKDREQSEHNSGFDVRSIKATVILDSALNDAVVSQVSQLIPQLLKLDTQRGDTLTILRAPLRPAWKTAFATPSDWRSAAYAGVASIVVLFATLIGAFALVRAGRALGQELAQRRGGGEAAPQGGFGEPLPELGADIPGGDAGGVGGPAGETPLLGRRFDFLIGKDMARLGRFLGTEKPDDLAVFFGHLAESIPDMASRLFAELPSAVQTGVSSQLIKLNVADPERLGEMEERLHVAVDNGVIGPESLGKILSRVPSEARADILSQLATQDARAVDEVERHVFGFEDLATLEIASLRRLLAAVPYDTWGLALRATPQEFIRQVIDELPAGPRELAQETVDKPQPKEKVMEARSKILDAFTDLVAKGEIRYNRAEANGGMV